MQMKLGRFEIKISHDARVLLLALVAGLPGVVLTVILLAVNGFSARAQVTVDLLVILIWLGLSFAARGRVA